MQVMSINANKRLILFQIRKILMIIIIKKNHNPVKYYHVFNKYKSQCLKNIKLLHIF